MGFLDSVLQDWVARNKRKIAKIIIDEPFVDWFLKLLEGLKGKKLHLVIEYKDSGKQEVVKIVKWWRQ